MSDPKVSQALAYKESLEMAILKSVRPLLDQYQARTGLTISGVEMVFSKLIDVGTKSEPNQVIHGMLDDVKIKVEL